MESNKLTKEHEHIVHGRRIRIRCGLILLHQGLSTVLEIDIVGVEKPFRRYHHYLRHCPKHHIGRTMASTRFVDSPAESYDTSRATCGELQEGKIA